MIIFIIFIALLNFCGQDTSKFESAPSKREKQLEVSHLYLQQNPQSNQESSNSTSTDSSEEKKEQEPLTPEQIKALKDKQFKENVGAIVLATLNAVVVGLRIYFLHQEAEERKNTQEQRQRDSNTRREESERKYREEKAKYDRYWSERNSYNYRDPYNSSNYQDSNRNYSQNSKNNSSQQGKSYRNDDSDKKNRSKKDDTSSIKDYYKLLGVSRDATQSEIKKAYIKIAKEKHPDKHNNSEASNEEFKLYNEAYEVLSDPQKRAQYDRFRRAS
jgi:hypothetical protein